MNDIERLKIIAEKSAEKISESAVFLSICSDNYIKNSVCLLELSLAILLDKPLFMLIQKGVKLSKKLIRMLDGYEFYELNYKESFNNASNRLLTKVERKLKKDDLRTT